MPARKFASDFLPGFRIGAYAMEIQLVECQAAGLQLRVVTRDAILIQQRLRGARWLLRAHHDDGGDAQYERIWSLVG